MVTVDEFTFNGFISSSPVAIVYFSATWCGPCRLFSSTYKSWAEKYSDKASWGKADVDDNFNLASTYEINVVPTLIVFKNNVPFRRFSGFPAEKEIIACFDD